MFFIDNSCGNGKMGDMSGLLLFFIFFILGRIAIRTGARRERERQSREQAAWMARGRQMQ